MKGRSEELRFWSAGVLGQGMLAALFSTVRFRTDGRDELLRFRREGTPVIFVFWHDQLLPLVHVHRGEGATVLVSEHADGEYIARVLERHGFETARGSSTRGGTRGLRELVRAARRGRDLALTPDGPRGPRHRFKPGALQAARLTGLPVIPLAAAASSAWRFDSWDRFMVPRPFSAVRTVYGPAHQVPRDIDRSGLEDRAARLEETLQGLTERAAALAGGRAESRAPVG